MSNWVGGRGDPAARVMVGVALSRRSRRGSQLFHRTPPLPSSPEPVRGPGGRRAEHVRGALEGGSERWPAATRGGTVSKLLACGGSNRRKRGKTTCRGVDNGRHRRLDWARWNILVLTLSVATTFLLGSPALAAPEEAIVAPPGPPIAFDGALNRVLEYSSAVSVLCAGGGCQGLLQSFGTRLVIGIQVFDDHLDVDDQFRVYLDPHRSKALHADGSIRELRVYRSGVLEERQVIGSIDSSDWAQVPADGWEAKVADLGPAHGWTAEFVISAEKIEALPGGAIEHGIALIWFDHGSIDQTWPPTAIPETPDRWGVLAFSVDPAQEDGPIRLRLDPAEPAVGVPVSFFFELANFTGSAQPASFAWTIECWGESGLEWRVHQVSPLAGVLHLETLLSAGTHRLTALVNESAAAATEPVQQSWLLDVRAGETTAAPEFALNFLVSAALLGVTLGLLAGLELRRPRPRLRRRGRKRA